MNLSTLRTYLLLCAAVPLLSSCATTNLTSVWRDPAYQDHPRKIMVIGMLADPGNKRIFEDEMVLRLREHGTDAFASYSVLPEQPPPDREVVEKVMRGREADAVIISRLMDRKSVTTYSAGPSPAAGYGGSSYGAQWQGYYGYQSVRQDEFTVIQTNLYDLKSEKLIWTAASETWMSENNVRLILSFIDVIVKKLARDKVISSGTGR